MRRTRGTRMATGRCGHTEHAPELHSLWLGFSTSGRLCAWDNLCALIITTEACSKAKAAHLHHWEERQPPRQPSTSPLPTSSPRQIERDAEKRREEEEKTCQLHPLHCVVRLALTCNHSTSTPCQILHPFLTDSCKFLLFGYLYMDVYPKK
ncbi:uncharacterized protein LOC119289028 isoform X1 [Triticum dicoccoides]|nr:uncharacterized protein LOC119289028 isoform X1 [Triticum dicoccoides]